MITHYHGEDNNKLPQSQQYQGSHENSAVGRVFYAKGSYTAQAYPDYNSKNCEHIAIYANMIYNNPPPVDITLAEVSDRDSVWDMRRTETEKVAKAFDGTKYQHYAERMFACSTYLDFSIDPEKGMKLNRSFFCHYRNCPVCQWRKSLRWKAVLGKAIEENVLEKNPNHHWLFLTLTVKNCEITKLKSTLKEMNLAWQRLIKRREFRGVVGWTRGTEVTRDKQHPNTHAHPHFHILLMVKPSYFDKRTNLYVNQDQWITAWKECMRLDYDPSVDIRKIKPNPKHLHKLVQAGENPKKALQVALASAISEVGKYSIKFADMLGDSSKEALQWFYTYTEEVHKLRFFASGGILKEALKDVETANISTKEMIQGDTEESQQQEPKEQAKDKRLLSFTYKKARNKYIYNHSENR